PGAKKAFWTIPSLVFVCSALHQRDRPDRRAAGGVNQEDVSSAAATGHSGGRLPSPRLRSHKPLTRCVKFSKSERKQRQKRFLRQWRVLRTHLRNDILSPTTYCTFHVCTADRITVWLLILRLRGSMAGGFVTSASPQLGTEQSAPVTACTVQTSGFAGDSDVVWESGRSIRCPTAWDSLGGW
ncbi:hypothetical protein GGR56DRAFT_626873, partial [Xylariaceae sp. FL0804]